MKSILKYLLVAAMAATLVLVLWAVSTTPEINVETIGDDLKAGIVFIYGGNDHLFLLLSRNGYFQLAVAGKTQPAGKPHDCGFRAFAKSRKLGNRHGKVITGVGDKPIGNLLFRLSHIVIQKLGFENYFVHHITRFRKI